MKRVAIVQPNYIPWKGYFDLIRAVDEFVLLDNVQYTRRDWRNRNRIKTAQGVQWLSIPVQVKSRYLQLINETEISDPDWARAHWKILAHNYGRAPHFETFRSAVEDLYLGSEAQVLSEIDRRFTVVLCSLLGISTPITIASELAGPVEGRSARLLGLCRAVGATEYLSGPSAREYLDVALFAANGISVDFADYSGYPEYPQLHPPFEHAVTVLDLLFNTGPDAVAYMKDARSSAAAPATRSTIPALG